MCRAFVPACVFIVFGTSCAESSTPTQHSATSPIVSISFVPSTILATVSDGPPELLVNNGRPWYVLNYKLRYTETGGVPMHIMGFETKLTLRDGSIVANQKVVARGAGQLVNGRSSGDVAKTPDYFQLKETQDPSGVLTATVHGLDFMGNEQLLAATAQVIPQQ